MNILLTSSRAPVTLELIRALAGAGHAVYACDTFSPTVGSHARQLRRHYVVPPPRYEPALFAQALAAICERHAVDWLIPTCEEVFYVAMHHALLAQVTRVFCDPLAVLAPLHHKFGFQRLADGLGLATPATTLVTRQAELKDALERTPRYLLKPAYSRFAARIITNAGPRAGALPLAACRPTPEQPWLVQEFLAGETICSYSTLHGGRVTAHCAYRIPHQAGQGAGISFLSIEGDETYAIAARIGAALGYTGQLSFDYIRAPDGRLALLECNPRATSGLHLLAREHIVSGLLSPGQPSWVEPAGREMQLAPLVLGQLLGAALRRPGRASGRHALAHAARVSDVVLSAADPLPALAQLAQVLHFLALSYRKGIGPLAATTDDIEWNGDGVPIWNLKH